eukprot:TRINITY_DN30471_c0_g1_i1.p1 TRINITY_DN30471_c0_g1~~TRINITY_DN30471_c0_g1_i1.p1  ORF type:complete len:920 (+),score=270.86 TRINITY_DN30471_c0_g1_i1:48-2807(+)
MPTTAAGDQRNPPEGERAVVLPGRRVVLPAIDGSQWADEFAAFTTVGGRWSAEAFSRWRIDQAAAFLGMPAVGETSATQRVRFLRLKGLSDHEIEEALREAGDARAELALACGGLGEDSDSEDSASSPAHADDDPRSLWRVGNMVYAYAGDHTYHLVPIVGTDFDRFDDVISTSLMLKDGSWAPPTWKPAGLKGIVADVFPAASDLREGMGVIAAWPGTQHFKEGVVFADATDSYVEIEFSHTGEITHTKLPLSDVRTVTHPLIAAREREDMLARNSAKVEAAKASASFPYPGKGHERGGAESAARVQSSPPAMTLAPEERGVLLQSLTDDERFDFAAPLRSLARFAPLDCDAQPSFLCTFADFVRAYGDAKPGCPGESVMPAHPPSQRDVSGAGFGFDFSRHQRHDAVPQLFKRNPLIDACAQCYARDSCFVDPDFPPSHHSIHGVDCGEEASSGEYEWRRLSEVCLRPRVTAPASDRWGLRPGAFRNRWLPQVISAVRANSEFDGIISPNDGSLHPFGCYSVRVFVDGRWHYVLVDDFVPVHTKTGEPACIRSSSDSEWYAAIIEKACAKLYGGYVALRRTPPGVTPERTWEDLTGGAAERAIHALLCTPTAFAENMHARHSERKYCVMLAQSHGDEATQHKLSRAVTSKEFKRLGLEVGGYGFVTDVAEQADPGTGALCNCVFVFNPYPAPVEDESAVQPGTVPSDVLLHKAQLPAAVVRALQERRIDSKARTGLWFPFTDYVRFHDNLLTLWHFDGLHRAAVHGSFAGKAGGSLFESDDRFFSNPQFALCLVLDRYTNVSSAGFVAAQLTLSERRFGKRKGSKPDAVRLQLHLLSGHPDGDAPLPPGSRQQHLFASNLIDLVDDDEAIHHPSAFFSAQLKPGRYVLIPDVGSTTSREDFTLRVWSNANFTLRCLN